MRRSLKDQQTEVLNNRFQNQTKYDLNNIRYRVNVFGGSGSNQSVYIIAPNKAALDLIDANPPQMAFTTDTNNYWSRVSGRWVPHVLETGDFT